MSGLTTKISRDCTLPVRCSGPETLWACYITAVTRLLSRRHIHPSKSPVPCLSPSLPSSPPSRQKPINASSPPAHPVPPLLYFAQQITAPSPPLRLPPLSPLPMHSAISNSAKLEYAYFWRLQELGVFFFAAERSM